MPMIPEAAYAMLACARIGAIHSVVFGGFSPDALAGRILDCKSKFLITADEGIRGGKKVPLKECFIKLWRSVRYQKCFCCKKNWYQYEMIEKRDILVSSRNSTSR